MGQLKSNYYTVQQIQELECCGKQTAYDLAKQLPHERRGKNQIFVFAEAYDQYYEKKKEQALSNKNRKNDCNNIYAMKKLSER